MAQVVVADSSVLIAVKNWNAPKQLESEDRIAMSFCQTTRTP
jgi:hypothetical protein